MNFKRLLPENLEKDSASVFLALIAFSMLLEAARRHLFPAWPDYPLKLAGGSLAWMASLGMARAAAVGAHVRVSCVERLAAEGMRGKLAFFADTVFLLFSLGSLLIGCIVLWRSLAGSEIPGHPLVYAAIPAGSILTICRLLERLGDNRRKGGGQ